MNRKLFLTIILFLGFQAACMADATEYKTEAITRFYAFDLNVNSGESELAAYQVEITYKKNSVKIVGIEGGETKAFNEAPYYDRSGLEGGRIIIASFTTKDAPDNQTRVARIHVASEDIPNLNVKLMTAAKSGGKRFNPEITITRSNNNKE